MIKSLYPKFQLWSEKGSVYLYSDPHFEDVDVMEHFGYMNAFDQVGFINSKVTRSDYLIILGDFGNPEWLKKIKTENLIGLMGNHDQSYSKYAPYFKELYTGPLFIGEKILLSHEPIGLPFAVNIHGHDHSNMESYHDGYKYYNVAANVINYQPVSLGKLINNGLLAGISSIHRITIDKATEKRLNKY